MGKAGEIVIKIEGMSCNHCKMAVEKALKEIAGVESANVDLAKKEAVVTGTAVVADLHKAIEETGFTVVA